MQGQVTLAPVAPRVVLVSRKRQGTLVLSPPWAWIQNTAQPVRTGEFCVCGMGCDDASA